MKKEIEIIEKLIKNPRASYAEIAKSLNLSPETVRQYLHRILKNKTLELHCVPDNRYLGSGGALWFSLCRWTVKFR